MNHAFFTQLMLRHMPGSPSSRTVMLPSYANSCLIPRQKVWHTINTRGVFDNRVLTGDDIVPPRSLL